LLRIVASRANAPLRSVARLSSGSGDRASMSSSIERSLIGQNAR
jgi:hypothetical protein